MINYKIILRVLGGLLYGEAVTMLMCMAVALCYQEDDILLFPRQLSRSLLVLS